MLAIKGAPADHDIQTHVHLCIDLQFFLYSILLLNQTQCLFIIYAHNNRCGQEQLQ